MSEALLQPAFIIDFGPDPFWTLATDFQHENAFSNYMLLDRSQPFIVFGWRPRRTAIAAAAKRRLNMPMLGM